jgi:glycosyltransferase involved in cell wall biosynthesis
MSRLKETASMELTILLPCLNEAETLDVCVDKAMGFLRKHKINGEVLVADNGSSDGSQELAARHGARVVNVPVRGYGAALMGGIEAAHGKYILMADADDSYDLVNLMPFISKLRDGYDLVMGNRFKGGIKPGAMKPLHKYLGNPVLTGIGKLFFRTPIGDFHCGIRGFSKTAIQSLGLQTTGMEFASEMVVKATLMKIRIAEVPTTLSPDGRSRPPHLRSWRDGWRHLRFLLIYSPGWLFLFPGILMAVLGVLGMCILIPGPLKVGNLTLDIHSMLYASVSIIIGFQCIAFSFLSKIFAINAQLLPENLRILSLTRLLSLEKGLVLGGLLAIAGLGGSIYALLAWGQSSFGALIPSSMMRVVIPSLTCLAVGIQIGFMSFFMSLLNIKRR